MRVLVTGGGGLVGQFVVAGALARGAQVTVTGRGNPGLPGGVAFLPWSLDAAPPALEGVDLLVHAAFAHLPGRYRGGEGDDPDGFRRQNVDGTARLFERARRDGVGRVVFLSSRAVYDGLDPGEALEEGARVRPDSLYGQVKLAGEAALAATCGGAALRVTGVYGPGPGHKWTGLFEDYLAGRPVAPRRATEVAGPDLAAAVFLSLSGVCNLSDMVLDRHVLLAEVARLTGCAHPPPPRSQEPLREMETARARAAGWVPGGMARLRALLPAMLPSGG
jgi:nucleoside-diphosphate-sugar epimerase